jgi:hypothetical protein
VEAIEPRQYVALPAITKAQYILNSECFVIIGRNDSSQNVENIMAITAAPQISTAKSRKVAAPLSTNLAGLPLTTRTACVCS